MPSEEAQRLVVMTATDAAASMDAEIEIYSDNTFGFNLSFMGGRVFGGTWQSSDPSNVMAPVTLTVDDTGKGVVGETITVNISLEGDKVKYTCRVDYVVPGTIELHFDFVGFLGEIPEPEPEPEPDPAPEPGEALYTSNAASIFGGMGSAYMALEEGGKFNVYVTFGGSTSSWLSGTWNIEQDVLTLTASWDASGNGATTLEGAESGKPESYPLADKAYTVAVNVGGAGAVDLVFDMDENSVTYTINYMLNDGTSTVHATAEIKGNPEEAYITAAPVAPTRLRRARAITLQAGRPRQKLPKTI